VNATRIVEGTLCVNGTNSGGGTVTVWPGAVLGGGGTVAPKAGASVVVDGTLAPGPDADVCGTLVVGSADETTTLALNGGLFAEVALATHDCVTVYGDVTFGAGATVTVVVTDEAAWQTRREDEISLLTYTGSKSGTFAATESLPDGWKVRESSGRVYLSFIPLGTLIQVR
jgi:hypothetical protein